MTNVLLKDGERTTLEPIIVAPGVDVFAIPRRGYDFNQGDRRFLDQQAAIDHANEEARRTGVRQVVRLDSREPGAYGRQFHLVQAVGS